ncbi:hypothetical protein GCM10027062_11970 [Nocardioides hungaricus]
MSEVRLLLLRHAEVASHRGDVPVTPGGLAFAEDTGKAIAAGVDGPISVLHGGTRRSRETAEAIVRGIAEDGRVLGPLGCFALRNPDLYLAGTRVDMVSSAPALAEQVPGLDEEDVAAHPWWPSFFADPDRIGWWLAHADPPGESGADLVRRVGHLARSLADAGPHRDRVVVGVTHSPLLRAVLAGPTGGDPGEPSYVTGVELRVRRDGVLETTAYDPRAR